MGPNNNVQKCIENGLHSQEDESTFLVQEKN